MDLGTFFRGAWAVTRLLVYARGGVPKAKFRGRATFRDLSPGVLLYEEKGELDIGEPGVKLEASQSYAFCLDRSPPYVCFVEWSDGQPTVGKDFHPLELDGDNSTAVFEHLCIRDLYKGELGISGPDAFAWSWRIEGPEKDGHLSAEFARLE